MVMSIGFSFTMEPKRKFFQKPNIQYDKLIEVMKGISKEKECVLDIQNDYIKIEYCPEGYFWVCYDKDKNQLSGDCQTNVAGPGFHVAAIDYLEVLSKKENFKLDVEDETGYFQHRDFDRMREEHFYPWLKSILELICDKYTSSDFRICWPTDAFAPRSIDKTVVMPIRRFSINEIKLFRNGKISDFAKEFFCWNHRERDAYFYRNCGLVLMNTRCFFMPSIRSSQDETINKMCIQLLEQGLSMMKSIPFPREDYETLCKLDGRKPMDISASANLEHACEIGYRKQDISVLIGQFSITIPGSYLEEYNVENHTMLYYDGEEVNWHNIRITSYSFEGDQEAAFTEKLFVKREVEQIMEFPVGEGTCRLALFKPVSDEEESGIVYYHMAGQLLLGSQLLLISYTYGRKEEKDTIINWYQRICGKSGKKSQERLLSYV